MSVPDAEQPVLTWCPSGPADAAESVVLGVRSGPSGQLSYLAAPVPAAEVLGEIPAGIEPTRILRFASHCTTSCLNRQGEKCGLVERIVAVGTESATGPVPRCHLRASCKWWHQAGVSACSKCPAVATAFHTDDAITELVADPTTSLAQLQAWIAESS